MRSWTTAFVVALSACSGTRAAGPIGSTLDLRGYLPDSIRAAVTKAGDSTFHHQIRVGPDSAPVEMTWTVATTGRGRYLTSLSAKLLQPVGYDSLVMGDAYDLKNVGSRWAEVEAAQVRVAWYKRVLFRRAGIHSFVFDASGQARIGLNEQPAAGRQ